MTCQCSCIPMPIYTVYDPSVLLLHCLITWAGEVALELLPCTYCLTKIDGSGYMWGGSFKSFYLCKGSYVVGAVLLFVSQKDYEKTTGPIFKKLALAYDEHNK